MRLEAAARTDLGPVRETNEDAYYIDVEAGVFLVADGMGGHASGEVASAIAVDTVRQVLIGEEDPEETRLSNTIEDSAESVRERMRYAMNQASSAIRREAQIHPIHSGMGTTMVALIVENSRAYIGHVGDSRAYLFRLGSLTRLTRDHTVVQQEIDAGRLTPELARVVPHKNMLTQSVGCHGPVEPDTSVHIVQDGDLILLCSDGLTDPLDDEQLRGIIAARVYADLAEELVEQALAHGTEDNVTAVVVGIFA